MIDTHLPGDPESVGAVADWLLGTLRTGTDDAGEGVVRARQSSARIWEGESGEAYRGFVRDVVRASDQASSDVLGAEDVFRQCATQMRRAQRTLESCRERAVAGGLQVLFTNIVPPSPADAPGPAPTGKTPVRAVEQWNEQQAAFEEQQRKAALYRQLRREAGDARREYEQWCQDTLGPAATRAGAGKSLAGKLLSHIDDAAKYTIKFQLSYQPKRLTAKIDKLTREIEEMRNDPINRKHPRRIPGKTLWKELLRDEVRRNPIKFLPLINRLWGLGEAAKNVADGESPGKEVFKYGGGVAGAAIVLTAIPVTSPVGVALLGLGAGIGGGKGGGWVWTTLPDDVREDIDAGFKRGWDNAKMVLSGDIAGVGVEGAKVLESWKGLLP